MKTFIISLIILSLQIVHATPSELEEITIVGRIEGQGTALRVIRSLEGDALPGMLQNPQLEETLTGLQKGDEVLIQGYVAHGPFSLEGSTQIRSIFIVQSIRPISLSKLGTMEGMKIPDVLYVPSAQKTYSPMAIPVTTEVASALTLTSSMLLLQSLTNSETDPQVRQQLNSGMIIFAGALATGIFIYEQISGSAK